MKNKLISTAIRQFGERGFDGASTRDIASEAGTTMSNITYHFRGKDGLYRAAAEAIVKRFAEVSRHQFTEPPPSEMDAEQRIERVCAVLRTIGAFMLSEEAEPLARFVAREQHSPNSIMREYFERDIGPMTDALKQHVSTLRPDLSDEQAHVTTFFLLSMAISLRSSRMSLCMFMDVPDIDDDLGSRLLNRLEGTVREVLAHPNSQEGQ
ncbi:CerR family C-terminal domain-containing protein [Aurantiacibacter sediminis]|uniref:CerR family C-terminal domain-containing protein n=1 Tax=Aurantiacibacter sediminis TaxID=2793064 RepID=A0ABS0N200_9SPHN|nr:CerR family C-terminal domain-containing protein [Aurantiacibacter sediminis]MBH5321995.1 CerR family C-terminal domain-containing protein [Aurantiacibacter sediminis]